MHFLESLFAQSRAEYESMPFPVMQDRKTALKRLRHLLQQEASVLAEAIARDFTARPVIETQLLELYPLISTVQYVMRHLKRWMRPQKRRVSWEFAGTEAIIHPQPLGVIGIIAPWNYPVYLALNPAIYAIAAGNRVMIKMSEYVPDTAETLAFLIKKYGLSAWISVMHGDQAVGEAFTRLPFQHLLFTGSTRIGRAVMRAASDNLTPVTLELGGKSPVIISRTANMRWFERILMGKLWNAGQTCLAPDYIYLPMGKAKDFEAYCRDFVAQRFHNFEGDVPVTSIISAQHRERLEAYIDEARHSGATVIPIGQDAQDHNRLALYLIYPGDLPLRCMEEEIFGTILPVILYDHFDTVLKDIRARSHPLTVYYFGSHRKEIADVIYTTQSGSVVVNDTVVHAGIHNVPFGGIGESGMGVIHAREGFERFSHAKPVIIKQRYALLSRLYPPYGAFVQFFLKRIAGFK